MMNDNTEVVSTGTMMMDIHYSVNDGKIMSYGSSDHGNGMESHFANCKIIVIPSRDDIGPGTHVVDLNTLELVKVSDEQRLKELLTEITRAVKRTISDELNATDAFIDPPSDRPMKGDLLLDWKPYRQILRDLSKLGTVQEMIEAWPLRPNGDDAIPQLREWVAKSMLLKSS